RIARSSDRSGGATPPPSSSERNVMMNSESAEDWLQRTRSQLEEKKRLRDSERRRAGSDEMLPTARAEADAYANRLDADIDELQRQIELCELRSEERRVGKECR